MRLRRTAILVFACWCYSASAQYQDLSNWTLAEFPIGIGGWNASDWALFDAGNWPTPGTTEARQFDQGAVASVYHSDFVVTHTAGLVISGTLEVKTEGDDDQIGLVFGFQDLDHLYLFQWKKGGCVVAGCGTSNAAKGMHIRRIDVQPGNSITNADVEGFDSTVNSTILADNDIEWEHFTTYDFAITFLQNGFRFIVADGPTVLADWTINDTTYTSGRVGFYSSSQRQTTFTMNEVPTDPIVELVEIALGTSTGPVSAQIGGVARGSYNLLTQSVTMDPGALLLQYDNGPSAGDELFDHALIDTVWDLQSGTVNVSAFSCEEGTQGAAQSQFLCANTDFGANATNDSTTDYTTVPGTRSVGGDDNVMGPQIQADDYGSLQTSWDGATLVAESPAWTATPGLAGYRLTFDVLVPAPRPVTFLLARLGTLGGVEEAVPTGSISATYDPVLGTVEMGSGSMSLPYLTGAPGDFSTFDHVLADASWNLYDGSVSYSNFDCIEGVHGATLNRFLCANTDYGPNLTNDTTTDYAAEPATRVIGADDVALGPQRQGSDYGAAQSDWDGTTLTIESPDWTANPDGSGGATTGYQLIFVDGSPPAVTIISPAAGMILTGALPVNLDAAASDPEDGDLGAQIQWTSNIDGALTMPAQLSVGAHILTASVSDSSGLTGSDAVAVTVDNGPTLTIDAPASGTMVVAGATVTLQGTATDVEDGEISASIQWTSNRAGSLGSGASLPVNLALGAHHITATVADTDGNPPLVDPTVRIIVQQDANSNGMPDSWEAKFGVSDPAGDDDGDAILNIDEYNAGTNPVDAAPQVTIVAPVNGHSAGPGDFVNFAATALDAEDGDLSANVRWSSNLDGDLGTGATLPVTLSLGTHTITATVTDSQGGSPAIQPMIQVTVALPIPGDFNGDGSVDVGDLLQLQQLLMP